MVRIKEELAHDEPACVAVFDFAAPVSGAVLGSDDPAGGSCGPALPTAAARADGPTDGLVALRC